MLRVPVLYALDCKQLSESASLTVAELLRPGHTECVQVDDWGIRFPTLVEDVSAVLKQIVDAKARSQSALPPVLHCSSPERTTKYELALLMANVLGVDASRIKPDPNPPEGAPRPRMTQLDCTATWEALGVQHEFTPLRDGIAKALATYHGEFVIGAGQLVTSSSEQSHVASQHVPLLQSPSQQENDQRSSYEVLSALHLSLRTTQQQSFKLHELKPVAQMSRSGWIATLQDLIGPKPIDRTWQDEWVALNVEFYQLAGESSKATPDYILENNSIESWLAARRTRILDMTKRGWSVAGARVYMALSGRGNVMASALLAESTRYAASTYALSEALYEAARKQEHEASQISSRAASPALPDSQLTSLERPCEEGVQVSAKLPPVLYWHRRGRYSLEESDKRWLNIEIPDVTGFLGLTSTAIVKGTADRENFASGLHETSMPGCPDGYAMRVQCRRQPPCPSFAALHHLSTSWYSQVLLTCSLRYWHGIIRAALFRRRGL